ncbi:hypothetical protein [Rubrobacter xylanophilus]|nr:hypothetical protein [Rubrobacter xylanophilus]
MMRAPGNVRLSWAAVALGWLVAACAGAGLTALLKRLYPVAVGAPVGADGTSLGLAVVLAVSGFLAYLLGGYVAGRRAGASGGINGAMTGLLGLCVGGVLVSALPPAGDALARDGLLPPAALGFALGSAPVVALLSGATLFGGCVGGLMGEPVHP